MRLTRILVLALVALALPVALLAQEPITETPAGEPGAAPVVAPGETPPVVVAPDGEGLHATEPLEDAPIIKPEGGIALAPLVAILTALLGVLGAVMRWIPAGWKTYTNLAVAGVTAAVAGLTALLETHESATFLAIAIAIGGSFFGKWRTGIPDESREAPRS